MTEADTPFKPSTTQKIFHNAANVQLRGHTYDAKHLDKFLGSNFGERSMQVNESGAPTSNKHFKKTPGLGSYQHGRAATAERQALAQVMNSANIKPSVAFMSMGRADYKQIKYTDEQDGPSSLQIIACDKTRKDKDPSSKNVFE